MSQGEDRYHQERARIEQGHTKYRDKLRAEGKLFVRDRLKLLLDPGTRVPGGLPLRAQPRGRHARRRRGHRRGAAWAGRTVCVMANDYTVKAGSWGEKTVQKIVRIQEKAARLRVPMLYLVDAAGGRISEQIKIFPGRFHAGRIFYNEVQLSGVVPQVCILFGPSPAGSAYLPALTDLRDHGRGQGLALRRAARAWSRWRSARRRRSKSWAARACTARSRAAATCWRASDEEAIELARRYLAYMPGLVRETPAARAGGRAQARAARSTTSCPTTSASGSTCTR